MQVHVERQFAAGRALVKVWIYSNTTKGTLMLRMVEPGVFEDELVQEGADAGEPTLALPEQMAVELGTALARLPRADEGVVEHLQDARAVRDRLLKIVEHKMGVA